MGLAVGNRSAAQVHAYAVAWRSALLAEPVAHPELVAEVRRLAGADCFVLVVAASVDAANQKAKVALGLALSLAAEDDARVLLMDADTREPCLHRMLELEMPEKTDFAAQLGARIRGSGDSIWHVVKCTSGLHVLPCATPAPDLIASEHFEHCVQDLRNFYDVVVVHGPVVNDTIACRAVNEISDGVVVTCAVGEVEPHRNLGAFTRRRLSSVVLV